MKILILCTGNSCRSQMAQGYLQSFGRHLEVHSAGTFPAGSVNVKAVEVMREDGIDISSNVTKSVESFLNETWDYVITVCDDAYETCPVFTGKVKHRLHMGFEDPAKATGPEDIVYGKFRQVRDEIKEKFLAFYNTNLSYEK